MPFVLESDLLAALLFLCPLAGLPMAPLGQVSRGVGGEGSGQGPAADRRPALPLVPRGERGRGPAAPSPGPRAGPPPAGLGGRGLDDDARPAWRSPGGPIPTWSRSTPRSTLAGRRAGPSHGSGRRCWPWSSWSSGPTWSGRRSAPGPGWRSSTAGSAPGATAATASFAGPLRPDAPPPRRRGRADRGVRRAVRRPGHSRASGSASPAR